MVQAVLSGEFPEKGIKRAPELKRIRGLDFRGEAGRIRRDEKLMFVQLSRPKHEIRVEPPQIDKDKIAETLTNIPEKTSLGAIFFDSVKQ